MTAPTQEKFDVTLDLVAGDESLPIKRDSREAVRIAVNEAARLNGWRITSADLRPYYPAWIDPKQVGATIHQLRARGHLAVISHAGRYGSKNNGDKRAPVYRVNGVIPKEAVQP